MRIPNWYHNESGGIVFAQAWNLHASGIVAHGFSTRGGGVSSGAFESLNLSLGTADEAQCVLENRRRFAAALALDPLAIVTAQQVHSNSVAVVTDDCAGRGALDPGAAMPGADALVTKARGVPLALSFADCACILLLDPSRPAVGAVHAGWRGTVAGAVTAAVRAMTREFGSEPGSMLAAIGPAIGRHCYNVGRDVALQMHKAFGVDERVLSQFSSDTWRADLKTANAILLRNAGLHDENVAISDECTACAPDRYFSYRRDGDTGRMGGWIALL